MLWWRWGCGVVWLLLCNKILSIISIKSMITLGTAVLLSCGFFFTTPRGDLAPRGDSFFVFLFVSKDHPSTFENTPGCCFDEKSLMRPPGRSQRTFQYVNPTALIPGIVCYKKVFGPRPCTHRRLLTLTEACLGFAGSMFNVTSLKV